MFVCVYVSVCDCVCVSVCVFARRVRSVLVTKTKSMDMPCKIVKFIRHALFYIPHFIQEQPYLQDTFPTLIIGTETTKN